MTSRTLAQVLSWLGVIGLSVVGQNPEADVTARVGWASDPADVRKSIHKENETKITIMQSIHRHTRNACWRRRFQGIRSSSSAGPAGARSSHLGWT